MQRRCGLTLSCCTRDGSSRGIAAICNLCWDSAEAGLGLVTKRGAGKLAEGMKKESD